MNGIFQNFIKWIKQLFGLSEIEKVIPPEDHWGLDLTSYGTYLAHYEGKGTLTLNNGQVVDCSFEAGQLSNGNVILLCASESFSLFESSSLVAKFHGMTPEGYELSTTGKIRETNYLADRPSGKAGAWAAFRMDELSVQLMKEEDAQSVSFGLTNFKFLGTTAFRKTNRARLSLPLQLKNIDELINLQIQPIERYEKVMQKLQTLKGVDVTCEAILNLPNNSEDRQLESVIDNLCRILSVARGTKVQWVYCDYYDGAASLIRRRHFNHITAPYCPLSIIDAGIEGRDETRTFIEGAYEAYLARCIGYALDRGTIDAYLDSKAENDYLEMRGAKLAVVLEKLKAVFLKLPSTQTSELILDEALFKKLRPKIKDAVSKTLEDANVEKDVRIKMHEKLGELNRRSFKDILNIFLDDIDFKPIEEDVKLFIQCRNKLVHTGDFYCNNATPEEKSRCTPLPSPAEEYYFMVNFLDRIFLRLLGYSGQYVDYRTLVPGPIKKGAV